MKYIYFVFVLLSMSCESTVVRSPEIKEQREREFGGKVKRILEFNCDKYWISNGEPQIDKSSCKIYSIKEYNQDEVNTQELIWFNLDYPNDPGQIFKVKTNESGLIVEKYLKLKQPGPFFKNETKTYFSYNQAGFENEEIVYIDGNFSRRVETIYDTYNCPIKIIYYDQNNKIDYYYVNEFDNRNRIISNKQYDKSNLLKEEARYKYKKDSKEEIVTFYYDGDGKLLEKKDKRKSYKNNKIDFLYASHPENRAFTDIDLGPNGKIISWHYKNQFDNDVYQKYDENERIVERKVYSDEEWQETFTWKYREDGAIIEESESTSKMLGKSFYKKTTYYKVDFNGNWIEKYIIDSESNITEIVVRQIFYY